jgi:hypothetical protein
MNAKNKTIEDYKLDLAASKALPAKQLAGFHEFLTDCTNRIEQAGYESPGAYIRAKIELTATEAEVEEFNIWKLDSRELYQTRVWFQDQERINAICKLLRNTIEERSKMLPGIIAVKAKQAADFTLGMFAPSRDREQIRKDREAAEDKIEDFEAMIANALGAVRSFEVDQDEASFGTACARVHNLTFPE